MNYKKFKHYIVVDEDGRPMTFQMLTKRDGQFCFAHTELFKRPLALEVYDLQEARSLIRRTIEFRQREGFKVGEYYLMPVKIKP